MNLSFDLQLFTNKFGNAIGITLSDKTFVFDSKAQAAISYGSNAATSFIHYGVSDNALTGVSVSEVFAKATNGQFAVKGETTTGGTQMSYVTVTALSIYGGANYNYKIAQTKTEQDLAKVYIDGAANLELNGFNSSGISVIKTGSEAVKHNITFTNSNKDDQVVLSGYANELASGEYIKLTNDTGAFSLTSGSKLVGNATITGGKANALSINASAAGSKVYNLKGDGNASVEFTAIKDTVSSSEINNVKKATFTIGDTAGAAVSLGAVKSTAVVIAGGDKADTIIADSIMSGSTANIKGGKEADIITLTTVKDFGSVSITGGDGADTINLSGTGNEIVIGLAGADEINKWSESAGATDKGNTVSIEGGFSNFATVVSGVENGQAVVNGTTITSSDATKYSKLGVNVATADDGTVSALLVGEDTLQSGANIKFENYSYIVADTVNGALNLGDTSKKVVFLGNTTAGDDNWGDTNAYVNIKSVTGSSANKSLLIGSVENGGATIKAVGTSDSVWGGDNGAADEIQLSDNKSQIVYSGAYDGLDSVTSGFSSYKAGKSNYVRFLDGVSYIAVEEGKFTVGADSSNGVEISMTKDGANRVSYGFGLEGGETYLAAIDASAAGDNIAYDSNINMYFGQGEKSTVSITSSAGAAKLNWDGGAGTSSIGTINGLNAAEGSILVGSTDMAQSIVGSAKGASSIAGGLADVSGVWTDSKADTLVGSGVANKATTFFVGANMGSDEIKQLSNGDTITFLSTKFSDLVNFKYDTTDGDLTFRFTGGTVEASLASGKKLSGVKDITFNFDDAKYVWDGKVFNYTNPNA